MMPASLAAQQAAAPAALAFRGVTVVDVTDGRRLPEQTVVIVGNRVQAMGPADKIQVPSGAPVVDARGKYLIPGLWDLHVHPRRFTHIFYPLFIANGVTGIRDAGSEVPIDTLQLWRREIQAGTRVGPPRQLLSGQSIAGPEEGCERSSTTDSPQTCVTDEADARHYVDSIRAAGADMIKPRAVTPELYDVIAAEARRLGAPFGGHAEGGGSITPLAASRDSAGIVDHELGEQDCWKPSGEWTSVDYRASFAACQENAKEYRRNGTWLVPSLSRTPILRGTHSERVFARFSEQVSAFWSGSLLTGNWLRDPPQAESSKTPGTNAPAAPDSLGAMLLAQRTDLPILAGTDAGAPVLHELPPGFTLHVELAMMVAEGLTPLNALQSATLNPAKFLHATDSLGTVAPGKLADLVLLDADPLADITNTTTVRAVVANGRYYDRAAIDSLLAKAQKDGKD